MSHKVGTFVHFDPARRDSPRSARVGWIVAKNGCHLWQGSLRRGYGHVWVDGRVQSAHRVRYEREVGAIPKGMDLDHFVCDNRACCNPRHCRPVTRRENNLRGNSVSAKAAAQRTCVKGHPLVPENLLKSGLARGRRVCRICRSESARARRHREARAKRAASAAPVIIIVVVAR